MGWRTMAALCPQSIDPAGSHELIQMLGPAEVGRVGSTRPTWWLVALLALLMPGCAGSSPLDGAQWLQTNADGGGGLRAGEHRLPAGEVGDYTTYSMSIRNASERDIRLTGASLVGAVGPIRLVDAYVVPPGRPFAFIASDGNFPPETYDDPSSIEFVEMMEPLVGRVIEPSPGGDPRDHEYVIQFHVQIDGGDGVAGYVGSCVEFQVGDSARVWQRCNDTLAFYACLPPLDACDPDEALYGS